MFHDGCGQLDSIGNGACWRPPIFIATEIKENRESINTGPRAESKWAAKSPALELNEHSNLISTQVNDEMGRKLKVQLKH